MARRMAVVLALASLCVVAGSANAKEPASGDLAGTWTRRAEGHRITITVRPEFLRLTFATPEGLTISLDADYVLTRDSMLVGILRTRKMGKETEVKEMGQRLFHCRCEVAGDALVLGRIEGKSLDGDDRVKLAEGMYRRVQSRAGSFKASGLTPSRPSAESINTSEDLRRIECEWKQIWFTDQPSHLTPERIHGGISQEPAPSSEYTPVPVMPWANERKGEPDFRTKTVPPVRGEVGSCCDDEPDRETILRALPALQGKAREGAEVVIEKIRDSFDPPRCFPLLGEARVHHCHWKCTVYYTQIFYWSTTGDYETPIREERRPRVEVVYLDTDHLHFCDGKDGSSAQPKAKRRIDELVNISFVSGPIRAPGFFEKCMQMIRTKWEQQWFRSQPSHLTPERVHGGIQ